MKIKICGLTQGRDIDFVNEAKPDYIGFVFAPSKRQISFEQAFILKQKLSSAISSVGVFVDAPIADIAELYQNGIITIAQLHGAEDSAYIDGLKKCCNISVIKAFNPSLNPSIVSMETISRIAPNINYFLFDNVHAGSGTQFDWRILEGIKSNKLDKPFFLAGGISLNNVHDAAAYSPYAVDVSSGVETDGAKDRKKIIQLVNAVRKLEKLEKSKN
ncbi:MAG: phosphoribosylanthranilate isomerase [Treponemataceae bacterium]|nr:MAG: phosphoribosylanthranilate isomerase [Treponemataceae bacterium]